MLTYNLNERGDTPLYEFLYESIAADIRSGKLPAAKKLPSKRALAKHLGVSLITVESAFSQLIAEGYVRSVERKGYYACDLTGGAAVDSALTGRAAAGDTRAGGAAAGGALAGGAFVEPWSGSGGAFASAPAVVAAPAAGVAFGSNENVSADAAARSATVDAAGGAAAGVLATVAAAAPVPAVAPAPASAGNDAAAAVAPLFDLRGGSLSSAFPYEAWARFLRETLSREPESALTDAKSPLGTLHLRQVLANYLREYRGMEVHPQQIVVGAGAQYLYGMIIQLLNGVRGACRVAIENPGYPRLEKIYRVNRVPVSYVPVDNQGIRMDVLASCGANVVHLTPSHQFPTGLVTSVPRRYELLSWAAQDPNRFIIEDDYDCEFRLAGKPIAPLQRLDAQGQVIYTNTFTKTLGGAFRIGYMVLPLQLAQRFERDLGFYSCSVSAVDQLALARFIESGAYGRHVNRLRTQYRTLRDAFIARLETSALAPRLRFASKDSGLHFLLGIADARSGADLARAAAREGVALEALQSFYQGNAPEEAAMRWLVAGYSSLPAAQVEACVAALERAWG